jgi:hypothetical protein|tara:strand:+ start:6101 stop:6469 length:369 start_codon:yes stop_codon:yes gene_type:complete
MKYETEKLLKVYKEHGKIIVGLDFDDTIFPLSEGSVDLCKKVKILITECQMYSTICLYTIADEQSLKYKLEILKLWGIRVDFVNESPIKLGNNAKPYFNILLDDKAGLNESYETLSQFNEKL